MLCDVPQSSLKEFQALGAVFESVLGGLNVRPVVSTARFFELTICSG